MQHHPFKTVGIMGLGMVGGAMYRYFEKHRGLVPGETLVGYDPVKEGFDDLSAVQRADIVFVAVPTPYLTGEDGRVGFDLAYVRSAIASLEGAKTIVIKSTVLPGTTDALQAEFPRHKLLFNPEFLTEVTADQDMNYPDRQLVGTTPASYNVAADVMALLPLAPFERVMPAKDAEMVKYFGNTWFSTKVIFANQMYDMCQAVGADYDAVKEAAAADKRIGRSHLEVFHKGYRGYGGKCLPKDTRALIELGERLGVEMALLKRVEELNEALVAARAERPEAAKAPEPA
jgi:UDPglucose 6-dehydrogenase